MSLLACGRRSSSSFTLSPRRRFLLWLCDPGQWRPWCSHFPPISGACRVAVHFWPLQTHWPLPFGPYITFKVNIHQKPSRNFRTPPVSCLQDHEVIRPVLPFFVLFPWRRRFRSSLKYNGRCRCKRPPGNCLRSEWLECQGIKDGGHLGAGNMKKCPST